MKRNKAIEKDAAERNHESYVLGCRAYDASEYQNALVLFKDALEYWPEDPQAWMALGNCYDQMKRPSKAEAAFRSALKYCQSKEREGILFNLGNTLFDQQRYSKAIEFYEAIQSGSQLWLKAQKNVRLAKERSSG